MQVIEKVKVVPEGYNGAGMNYDGCNRRDVNGKANAGLTLGIIGTALGAWALFGNRRSSVLGGANDGTILAKRAIMNNIDSFDKFLKPIADKDDMIDIVKL